MGYSIINIVIPLIVLINKSNARLSLGQEDLRRPFDQELYKNVLDPLACRSQVSNITQGNPLLLLRFMDAGIRTPRGVLQRNLVDMGNYHQCLGIDEELSEDMRIEGKYCVIHVPTDQELHLPEFPGSWLNENKFRLDEKTQKEIEYAHSTMYRAEHGYEDFRSEPISLPPIVFRLAVCIPKPCTTEEAMSSLLFNLTAIGFEFQEEFCRLPNDKPWVGADTAAVVVFSVIGFVTLLSTCYDLCHTLILKRDPKSANTIGTSFSVYTNTNRLLTFRPIKGALECLDGIRVLSMMWVIIGHTVTMHPVMQNVAVVSSWMMSVDALWLTTAPIAVDTFLMIAGVLLVYTTAGKMSGRQLISKLHLFYLNRLLRMFPALAAIVLLEASVLHRIADGPAWSLVARNAQRCRTFWWTTLLHVQNHVNPTDLCVAHSWYIAIDIQLYIVSPVVLFWVLRGGRRSAWAALVGGLLSILAASTVYNFIMELPGGTAAINRWDELDEFLTYYYFNTLTRGAPFFVGMICGYVLHLYRGTKPRMHMILVCILWVLALALFAVPFYTTYLIKQPDWDNQTVDSLINSFQRSLWAVCLAWVIFACVHGYGGPINWLLCLPLWKLPSRLSYAMYLYHYPIMFVFADREMAPIYFSVTNTVLEFFSQFSLVLMVALVVGVVIEAPFNTLFKLMLDKRGTVKPKKALEDAVPAKNDVTS